MTAGSTVAKQFTFQVADVCKPLLSVAACADMGFDFCLGERVGMLYGTVIHETISLDRKGIIYLLNMWVRQDPTVNVSRPFARPG